jgi:hypothetical protein
VVGIVLIRASFAVLLFVFLFLSMSACGKSKVSGLSAPPTPSRIIKNTSTPAFSSGVIDESATISSIAYDPDGVPSVAYIIGNSLYFATWDGSDWDNQTYIDSASQSVSLAFNSTGCPSILYYQMDSPGGNLMWALDEDDDGDWDDNANWPMTLCSDLGQWGEEQYTPWIDNSRSCSHDIYSNKYGFAFYDDVNGTLQYYEYDIITSTASQVTVDDSSNVGRYCSLKFDGNTPRIAFFDEGNSRLMFAKYYYDYGLRTWTWSSSVVDDFSGDIVGEFASLSYKSSGVPTIAYYVRTVDQNLETTSGHPYFVKWDSTNMQWDTPICLDNSSYDYGQYISLDWNPAGTEVGFAFGYYYKFLLWDTWKLRYILYDGSTYTLHIPDSGKGGRYASYVWEDNDTAWISSRYVPQHYDLDNSALRYVEVAE